MMMMMVMIGKNKYSDAEGVVIDWVFDGLWCNAKSDHNMVPHEPANKVKGDHNMVPHEPETKGDHNMVPHEPETKGDHKIMPLEPATSMQELSF